MSSNLPEQAARQLVIIVRQETAKYVKVLRAQGLSDTEIVEELIKDGS